MKPYLPNTLSLRMRVLECMWVSVCVCGCQYVYAGVSVCMWVSVCVCGCQCVGVGVSVCT